MDDEKKSRGGFTVSELEGKAKKYCLEICLTAIFILTAIFTLVWGGSMLFWSILLAMILAIVGALAPKQIGKAIKSALEFAHKEKASSITAAAIGILLSIFVPALIFAFVGLVAGKSLACECCSCKNSCSNDK